MNQQPTLPFNNELRRRCLKCGHLKSEDDFYDYSVIVREKEYSYKKTWCKLCINIYQRERNGTGMKSRTMTCSVCKKKNVPTVMHHVIMKEYCTPEQLIDPEILLELCKSCHRHFHYAAECLFWETKDKGERTIYAEAVKNKAYRLFFEHSEKIKNRPPKKKIDTMEQFRILFSQMSSNDGRYDSLCSLFESEHDNQAER